MVERMHVERWQLWRGRMIQVRYRWYVPDGPEQEGSRDLGWSTFMDNLTAAEKSALQSINNKMVTWLKSEVPELADAEDDG